MIPLTPRPSYYHTILVVMNSLYATKEVCGKPQRRCGAVAMNTTTVTPWSCIRGGPRRRLGAVTTTTVVFVSASSCICMCYQTESWCRKHSDRSIIIYLLVNSTTTRDFVERTKARSRTNKHNDIRVVVVSTILVVVFSSSSSSCSQEEVVVEYTRQTSA